MTQSMLLKKSFPYGLKSMKKPYRLFCFHHAGGSVVIFNKWRSYSPSVDVIPVEIPGRGNRMEESCITDFETLIKQTSAALAGAYDGRPFFIYGHSLGAAVAFETACALQRIYNIKPQKLIVAGRHAPMDPDCSDYRCSMGLEALKKDLLHLGMMDQDTLEDETFQQFFLPMIYKDYQLHEDYQYQGGRLDIPVIAMNGKSDDTADADQMDRWALVTDEGFTRYEFEGGHFFPYEESENEVLQRILIETKMDRKQTESAAYANV